MGTDYNLKQHLKMSPNAQIKNLVPETLSEPPLEADWKLGRIWYNSTIGKFQTISLKIDSSTGLPKVPNEQEVVLLGSDEIGFARDGEYYPDGLFNFNTTTKVSTAVDEINEALKDLAPAEATPLNGDMMINVSGGFKSGRVSKLNASGIQLSLLDINEGDLINYIITTNKLSATLPTLGYIVKDKQQSQFGKADQGIIIGYYDGISVDEGVNLFDNFNESSRDIYGVTQGYLPSVNQNVTSQDGSVSTIVANPNKANYESPTGFLTINTVERYNDFKKWQKGEGVVNIGQANNNMIIEAGRHTFYVKHSDGLGGNYSTTESEIFYDPDNNEVVSQINSFSIDTSTSKYVSGVPFHNDNITFKTTLTVTNAFAYTYWDKPIRLSLPYTDAGLVDWNDTSSNLVGETVPFWDDTINLTNYVITYTGINTYDEDVTLSVEAGKVSTSWGTTVSSSLKLLIDTHPISGNSTNLYESFNDEDYRLLETTDFDSSTDIIANIGSWDSTVLLPQFNAQQYMGTLKIAQDNYSTYGAPIDYSSYSNDIQTYYRAMISSKPNSNGQIQINTTATIGTDYEVAIKFPSITGWLDISKLYDAQDFANNKEIDGTACATLINKVGNNLNINWTIGTNSTLNSGYLYALRVTIKNKNITINEISEISENWS